jgi:hypothetical protein
MFRIFLYIVLIIPSLLQARDSDTDSLLNRLDKAILNNKTYMQVREQRIAGLKNLLKNENSEPEFMYKINLQIYNEYRIYNIDSALHFLHNNLKLAESINSKELINESRLFLSRIFSASGMYKESMDMLLLINRKQLNEQQKVLYYSCNEFLYSELNRNTRFDFIAKSYRIAEKAYFDSLFSCIDKSSIEYWYLLEKSLMDDGQTTQSRKIADSLLSVSSEGTAEYAYAAYRMAVNYFSEGDLMSYEKYLILSATSDVMAAIKDNTSLSLLATQLYKENQIDRAYRYAKFALEDANFFNARLRLVQVSNILPVINQAYQSKNESQKTNLRRYLLVISILSLFLITAVLFIYFQMKNLAKARNNLQEANNQLLSLNNDLNRVNNQLKELNLELSETNTIKEQYIGLFLNICSAYIDKLDNFRRTVNKMISSAKVNELYETTRSRQMVEDELNDFYTTFDNTFLHIFPDFVDQLNNLLLPEEQIILKKGELLNTELRIFALIRLGITDSSKIASLLRYSVNTIYNYRVKIKNKASVPRENFEEMILKIGTFSG